MTIIVMNIPPNKPVGAGAAAEFPKIPPVEGAAPKRPVGAGAGEVGLPKLKPDEGAGATYIQNKNY